MEENNQCNLCGKPIDLGTYMPELEIPKHMRERHICYRCAFWEKRLEFDMDLEKEGKIALVTPDWNHWIIRKLDRLIQVDKNFGGAYSEILQPIYRILAIDPDTRGFAIYFNNNPTHQGIIPEHLRDLYQVNAIFLSLQEYQLLQDRETLTYEYCKNIVEKGIF